MSLTHWLRTSHKPGRNRKSKEARRLRPRLETLEDRCVPSGNFQPIGPFPAFGADSQPGIIFTIGSSTVTTTVTGQGPFDGSDDSYVAVRNLSGSGVTISTLNLSGPSGFTGFDGDGIRTFGGTGSGPTGYEGPATSFSNITPTSITINFSDDSGNPLTPGNQTYFSLELPPSALDLLIAVPPPDQNAVEGASHSFALGAFTASGSGPFSVSVDWGDSSNSSFSQSSPGPITPQSHVYAEEGTYTVSVKVTAGSLSSTESFKVNVSDPAVLGTPVAVGAVEGAAFTGKTTATFTDPGGAEAMSSYSATINWGDLTPTIAATITGGTPLGSSSAVFTVGSDGIAHTYAEEGTYDVTTTINHAGIITVVHSTATVADPAVVGTPISVNAKEAISTTVPVATFTDPGGAELTPSIAAEYQANIDWGDSSSSAGTISYSDGAGSKTAPFTVNGTHAYAEEGTYNITVTISHDTAPNTVVKTTAMVRDNFGLLVLDPTNPQALMITGNAVVTMNHSGAVVVDSSDPSAIFLVGHGTLQAAETDVTGDIVEHGPITFSGELNHEAATADPIGLGLPTAPPVVSAAPLIISSGVVTLGPGTYVGGIQVTGTASVTLSPGVYYMKGGGFSASGQATVTGTGVLLVNAPAAATDTISITGDAVVTLTASNSLPDGYAKYDGIAVMQDPASTNPILVAGNPGEAPSLIVTGTVYAPKALLQVAGNGNMVVSAFTGAFSTVGGVVVVNDAMVVGNGALTINADPPPGGAGALINFPSHARSVKPMVPLAAIADFASMTASTLPAAPATVTMPGSPNNAETFFTATTAPQATPLFSSNSLIVGNAGKTEEDDDMVPSAEQLPALPLEAVTPASESASTAGSSAYMDMLAATDNLVEPIRALPADIVEHVAADGYVTPSLLGVLGLTMGLPAWWRSIDRRKDKENRRRGQPR
jgi:PKD repeat protein